MNIKNPIYFQQKEQANTFENNNENRKNTALHHCSIADSTKNSAPCSEKEEKNIDKIHQEDSFTFKKLFHHWLNEKSCRVRNSSLSIYRCYINAHFLPSLGEEHTKSMTETKLKEICQNKLFHRVDGNGDISNKSRIDLLRVLNNILRFGVKKGYLENLIQLDYPKAEKKQMNVLREQELARLEQCLYRDFPRKEACGIYLCLYTGLRVGELCGLQWGDIDLDCGILTVRRTVQRISLPREEKRTKVVIGLPKSPSSLREIPIPDHLLQLLKTLKQGERDTYFLSSSSHCMEPRRIQRIFSTYLERANISHRGIHCTRHTFATRWVEIGADIKTLSEILGHTNIRITLDKYVHISEKTKRENINKIRPLLWQNDARLHQENRLLLPSDTGGASILIVNV